MFMKPEHDNDNHIHKMYECTCISVYTCMSVFINAPLPCLHKNHIVLREIKISNLTSQTNMKMKL